MSSRGWWLNWRIGLPLLYAVMQVALGLHYGGPWENLDSIRYQVIGEGRIWDVPNLPGNEFYLGYGGLIWLLNQGNLGLWPLIGLQILALGGCVWLLAWQVYQWTRDDRAAWLTGLLCLACLNLHAYAWMVLTEALFVAGATGVLLTASDHIAIRGMRLPRVTWWLLLVWVCFIRPTGFVLLATLGLVWLWRLPPRRRLIALGIVLVGLVLVLNLMLASFTVVDTWANGIVIYASPPSWLAPPGRVMIPPADLPPLLQLLLFAWHQPLYTFSLMAHKVFWLLVGIRPYYSLAHNAYILVLLLGLYGLAMRGWRRVPFAMRPLLGVWLVLNVLMVAATNADWDNRLLLPLLPPLCLMGGLAWRSPAPQPSLR